MPDTRITMYARERYCPDVERSRNHLAALNISWEEFDIEADDDARRSLHEMTGVTRVPTILIGPNVLIEPSNDELDQALSDNGFPIEDTATG